MLKGALPVVPRFLLVQLVLLLLQHQCYLAWGGRRGLRAAVLLLASVSRTGGRKASTTSSESTSMPLISSRSSDSTSSSNSRSNSTSSGKTRDAARDVGPAPAPPATVETAAAFTATSAAATPASNDALRAPAAEAVALKHQQKQLMQQMQQKQGKQQAQLWHKQTQHQRQQQHQLQERHRQQALLLLSLLVHQNDLKAPDLFLRNLQSSSAEATIDEAFKSSGAQQQQLLHVLLWQQDSLHLDGLGAESRRPTYAFFVDDSFDEGTVCISLNKPAAAAEAAATGGASSSESLRRTHRDRRLAVLLYLGQFFELTSIMSSSSLGRRGSSSSKTHGSSSKSSGNANATRRALARPGAS
ncbi:hypothetical protein ACSSS7_007307 [Eimeria intestinalis]